MTARFFDDVSSFLETVQKQRFDEMEKEVRRQKQNMAQVEKRIAELDRIFKRINEDDISGTISHERFLKLSAEYEAEQKELTPTIVNEFVKKIIVHAPDRCSGHRRQKIQLVWNFIGEVNLPNGSQTVEQERKNKTASL